MPTGSIAIALPMLLIRPLPIGYKTVSNLQPRLTKAAFGVIINYVFLYVNTLGASPLHRRIT